MAFGSMLGLLGAGSRPHRFYLLAVFVAKGLVDLDYSGPADGGRQAVHPGLLDFGLIATGSAGGELLTGGLQGRQERQEHPRAKEET